MNIVMSTNFPGRLRNTSLPYRHGLLTVFEAVVNSIHSIDDIKMSERGGEIIVEILRHEQNLLAFDSAEKKRGRETQKDIIGFKVTDNGIGFNDANMKSFCTLDSDYKAAQGCRGVGRLMWLKAFSSVNVTSTYQDGDTEKSRAFIFDATSGVKNVKEGEAPSGSKRSTCVHLKGFKEKYREVSHKSAAAIANNLFEHCLWYFVRSGAAPRIIIKDGNERIDLDEVYEEHMVTCAVTETISIKEKSFDLTHIKLRANTSQSHVVAFCAGNRPVKVENITGKIPGLYGKIRDEDGDFVYACYVSSAFLDETARPERTGFFDMMENVDGLFAQKEISLNEIRDAVISKASEHLSEYLEEGKKEARNHIEDFVSNKAPRYRPILARIPEDELNIDPNTSEKELELFLHKHLSEIEGKLLADGHDIMRPKENEGLAEYNKRLQEYLKTAEDIKRSDLANYVSHRKVILDLLEKATERHENGRYCRENLIHNLIMPMRKESNEVMFDSCNLWLLDERLAFHDYLASDKTLLSMPITDTTETKEPDLCALNVFDNPILVSEGDKLPLASIVVVEIKKPMRNDAGEGEDKDPIEQALGYLNRIRRGKVKTVRGRPIPESVNIPGFCYVICDITESIKERCNIHDAIPTSDGLGYFFYHKKYKAYVEVISYNQLVNAAKERNRAFFDKLGLPTT